ncbi:MULTISPECIES: anti-sigma F factor antagonist [Clostridium]|uniref:Anti-sigma F factor antagonist n=1 Tax=Clostridium novyi (strain NT) TaxID=386415 RepID=A0PZS5_CLONN|nr:MULTISPECIES: anti-sigma F factor antagonist [Clostridium]ABK61991.1 anti-sigma F factor antagonist [Clostridium novyi NT]KEH84985.1 anti-anti-sigma factor [Clostridium novyi A str. 4540]KEH86645.1 anti-anti-sigma factor [Clostridium novyi A str. BKT29909]KEH88419.1 anti-anti-sigma factor [Clostridium novyi A str. NCTC 538]KEH90447.1 anti-anti-sigma factor [Clostridium novyi A str. GD211209]
MNLVFEEREDILIVHMEGELDHHTAEEVRSRIDDRIDRTRFYKVIMDFTNVNFMDSSGIGVVIGRYKKLLLKKGKINMIGAKGAVKRVFELSGMFKIIPLYDSLQDAMENI